MFQDGDDIFLTQNRFSQVPDEPAEDICSLFGLPVPDELEDIQTANFQLLDQDDVFSLIGNGNSDLDLESAEIDDDLAAWAEQIETQHPPISIAATVTGPENTNKRIKRIVSDDEIKRIAVKSTADNTKKKMRWAINVFRKWQLERNELAKRDENISCIAPDIEEMTKDELCYSLSRFICEVIKENGEDYPGQTLYEILINIQMYFEQKGKCYKFLNEDAFLQVKNTLDFTMKQRAAAGLGINKKKAETILVEEEELLWQRGILGDSNPARLVDTIVYLIGLHFALRAGKEHRNLRMKNSQITILERNGETCLKYSEDISKSNQGGLKTRRIKQKQVYAYEDTANPDRCIVRLYKKYIEHCPEQTKTNVFYLRPLSKPKENIWYTAQPIGLNTLAATVGKMCTEAGLQGFRSNHSLRATAATRLYECGVDEQIISEVTGHRSDAVREYKRTSETMRRDACGIIRGDVPKNKKCRKKSVLETRN
ncbi:unnamed protein product [Mytilus edulis]|uniref:DUF3504 domain-containing protein n=1 Tax=Mytilus edulis TaxID=6550 RepID=A0A8S3QED6_MYTED|nr:unnamed protein product [Mytilus edulis]